MAEQIPIQPRLLTKEQAAAYVGMTRAGYDRLRRAGKVPDYVPGTWRIDKVALDAAIDDMAKTAPRKAAEPEAEDPIEAWRRRRAERKAAEAQAKNDRAVESGSG